MLVWGAALIALALATLTENSDIIIIEDAKACFRLFLKGRKVSERHVRSSLPVLTALACQQECQQEKHFTCEGFNYRHDSRGFGRGNCEMVSVPSSHLDPFQDFLVDEEYNYYERDRNGPPDCNPLEGGTAGGLYGGSNPYGHWGKEGSSGSSWGYGHGAVGYRPQASSRPGGWRPEEPRPGVATWRPGGGGSSSWSYGGVIPRPTGGSYRPGGSGWDRPTGGSWGHREPGAWGAAGDGVRYERPPPSQWSPGWGTNRPPYRGGAWQGGSGGGGGGWNTRPPTNEPEVPYGYREECFIRSRAGFRLDSSNIKVSHAVPSLYDCEVECAQERRFVCLSFSFRYSLQPNFPQNNCQLSGRHYRELDPYTDLLPDRDYDVYARNEEARECGDTPPPYQPDPSQSECFRRVRSGQRLDRAVVRDSLSVQSVVECELECLRSRYFTCRIFSFRYGSATSGGPLDSCLLSDWPLDELQPARHLQDDLSFELYERGSFGHGCELDRPPHLPYPSHPPRPPPNNREHPRFKPSDELCYVGYGGPARLLPQVVKSSLLVRSELDCKTECNRARDSFTFYCAALSFRAHSTPNDESHNCLLSDMEQRDLRPGSDYIHEADNWMFAWNSRDPHCQAPTSDVHVEEHLGDREMSNTWSRFTVSGRPCRYGTTCTENHEAGFWACELEGGDAGAWDYCCRPGHQCGYSEGYSYPWCYVGVASHNQWRPCSDRYYPYPPGGGHGGHGGYNGFNSYGGGPSQSDYGGRDNPSYLEYGPPRYWPVAYLHREAPPNSTIVPPSVGPAITRQSPHVEVGFDNYVDAYRSGFGKKMLLFDPNNISNSTGTPRKTAERNFVLGVSLTSQNNGVNLKPVTLEVSDNKDKVVQDKEKVPTFEVVDESEEKKDGEDSTSELPPITKLQPRFVVPRGEGKVARSVAGDSKSWRWATEGNSSTLVRTVVLPVEFRRKAAQLETFAKGELDTGGRH